MTETFDETQATINAWQRRMFPNATTEGVFNHLREEFKEFLADPSPIEAADIIILLYCWADKHSIVMQDIINDKMAVNRMRDWNIQPDGTGRHT